MPPVADPAFTPVLLEAADGARAEVLPYGAHVRSWHPAPDAPGGADERLFVSARAEYRPGAAIRGGIPVIFPQFGDVVAGPGPSIRHGFARTRPWAAARVGHAPDGAAVAEFVLADDAETRARWPHPFRLTLRVRVGGAALGVALAVENTGDAEFAFTGALHTYLRVGDVGAVRVRGLEQVGGRDQAIGGSPFGAAGVPLAFTGEVDRIYVNVPGMITVDDAARARVTHVELAGFPDAVLWNPGEARAAALADLEPGGWRHFVCVEAAAAARPVRVGPGERWEGAQHLAVAPAPAAGGVA